MMNRQNTIEETFMKIAFLAVALILTACASNTPKSGEPVPTPSPTEATKQKPQDEVKGTKKTKAKVKVKSEAETEVKTEAQTQSQAGEITCKAGDDERKVAVAKTEAGGCEVLY